MLRSCLNFRSSNAVLIRANCKLACHDAQTDIILSNAPLFLLSLVSPSLYFYSLIIFKSYRQNMGGVNRAVSTVVNP